MSLNLARFAKPAPVMHLPPGRAPIDYEQASPVALAALNWRIGAPLALEPLAPGSAAHEARLIGYVPGESLLVTLPTLHGRPIKVGKSQSWGIRALIDGTAYRFVSTVQCLQKKPFAHLCLTYPGALMPANPRRHVRHTVLLQATLRHHLSHAGREGIVLNLSEGGACFATNMPPAAWGPRAVLDLDLSNGVRLSVGVALRSVQPQHDNGFRAGLAFEDIGQAARTALDRFLMSLEATGAAASFAETA
jgi:hypothetical protein